MLIFRRILNWLGSDVFLFSNCGSANQMKGETKQKTIFAVRGERLYTDRQLSCYRYFLAVTECRSL